MLNNTSMSLRYTHQLKSLFLSQENKIKEKRNSILEFTLVQVEGFNTNLGRVPSNDNGSKITGPATENHGLVT